MTPEKDGSARPAAVVIPGDAAFFDTAVCGTSLLLRALCALGRVTDTVHVLRTPSCAANAAEVLEHEMNGRELRPRIVWTESPESIPLDRGAFVVSTPAVFDHRLCERLEQLAAGERIVRCRRPEQPEPPLWFVGGEEASRVLRQIASNPAGDLDGARVADVHPDSAVCEVVSDESSRRRAEKKLLAGLRKESDSFVARYFDRNISAWITRRLMNRRVTPNQITLCSTAIGLLGAALLFAGTYAAQLLGSILLVLCVIIDGCDGEVARLKFMESSFGRHLDFLLDNVVNTLAIFAAGAGYYFRHGEVFYLHLSIANTLLALASIAPVYMLFFRGEKSLARGPRRTGFDPARFAEGLCGRDFVHVLLALALIGRIHWFAVACVIGLSFFSVFVTALAVVRLAGERGVRRQPGARSS